MIILNQVQVNLCI